MTHRQERAASVPRAAPTLVELERVLSAAGDPLAELRALASPRDLHTLLYLQLCRTVKLGPPSRAAAGIAPHTLLSIAQQAAQAGFVPVATPVAMRACLAQAEAEVREADAWRPDAPLWWQPMPPPSPLERRWHDWQARADVLFSLPAETHVSAAFADHNEAPLWLPLPAVLDRALVQQIHGELSAGDPTARLALEPGRVGAQSQRSVSRSDWVGYLSGTEPHLLAAAPTLAALIQWCLGELAERLLAMVPRPLSPPERVMLARYPAPSRGYAPHLDNVGGEQDNERTLTLVLYLNPLEHACTGGELALWAPGDAEDAPPKAMLRPDGGDGILFDARTIVHQVRAVGPGEPRWAIVVWFRDADERTLPVVLPSLTPTDVLLSVADPPLPDGVLLYHHLDDPAASGRLSAQRLPPAQPARAGAPPDAPRVGIVSTVYRGGQDLDAWCAHHFALGIRHIVLIFDRAKERAEAADAARLRAVYPPERLTIWSGRALLEEGWRGLAGDPDLAQLVHLAGSGASSAAVSARQTLNASVALRAAQHGELGGGTLDWLLHLDCDELFYLEGAARGGATLCDHYAAASAAGLCLIRYVNHELLLPHRAGAPARFKVSPSLASARLGPRGWTQLVQLLEMSQFDPRPYFSGYLNGKSAVDVGRATLAAGVHSWSLAEPYTAAHCAFLAGPSILHYRFATAEAFRHKYLDIASSPFAAGERPFDPSPTEVAALALIRSLKEEGASHETITQRLDTLYDSLTSFSGIAVELLEEAGLILTPALEHPLSVASVRVGRETACE